MRIQYLLLAALWWAGSSGAQSGAPVPPPMARVPATIEARRASALIVRAREALGRYVAAASSRDQGALSGVFTQDAIVEYALESPGTFVVVDADTLLDSSAADGLLPGRDSHISNLWIYPTNDNDAVFVQYETSADPTGPRPAKQIALVEMRGERIARMLNLSSIPHSVAAGAVPAPAPRGRCPRSPIPVIASGPAVRGETSASMAHAAAGHVAP